MTRLATLGSLLAAVSLVAACSSSLGSSGPPAPAASHTSATRRSSSAAPTIAPTPKRFLSKDYGYAVSVPVDLTPRQAFAKWDGRAELDGTSAYVDLFGHPSESSGMWAAARPWKRDLAAYTAFTITWNGHFHGDFCPHPPTRHRVTVGGIPGVLLAYNCGILVNHAVTVHHGIGYWFVFVDQGVPSATDPHDHATFVRMLSSVQFRR